MRGRRHVFIAIAAAITIAHRPTRADDAAPGTSSAPSVATEPGRAVRYQLENGLSVILEPSRDARRVAVGIRYDVGTRDDPDGYHGLTHLAEHMLFRGSRHSGDRSYMDLLQSWGADFNGITYADHTFYFEVLPTTRLEGALWLEADRMGFALDRVDRTAFESDRRDVISEYRTRVENVQLGRFVPLLEEAVFDGRHSYRHLGDEPGDLEAMRVENVQWFVQRWYVPSNATLVVTGRFETDAARRWIERYFGSIARGRAPEHAAVGAPPARTSPRRIEVYVPAQRTDVAFAWPTAAANTDDDAALDIIGRLVEERLTRSLVAAAEMALRVEARQSSLPGVSFFSIRCTATTGTEAGDLQNAIVRELRALAERVTADDVARGRDLFIGEVRRPLDEPGQRAVRLAITAAVFRGEHPIDAWLERYSTIDVTRVRRLLRQALDPNRATIAVSTPWQ